MLEDPYQDWSLRAAVVSDAQWIAELRASVLRPDLERLGRFDPDRVRQEHLYLRAECQGQGVVESQDAVDVFMVRHPR